MSYHKITKAQIAYIEQLQHETSADLPLSWRCYSSDNATLLIRQLTAKLEPKPYATPRTEQMRLL